MSFHLELHTSPAHKKTYYKGSHTEGRKGFVYSEYLHQTLLTPLKGLRNTEKEKRAQKCFYKRNLAVAHVGSGEKSIVHRAGAA